MAKQPNKFHPEYEDIPPEHREAYKFRQENADLPVKSYHLLAKVFHMVDKLVALLRWEEKNKQDK